MACSNFPTSRNIYTWKVGHLKWAKLMLTIILIRGRTDKKVQEEENRDLAADKDTKGFGSHQKLRRKGAAASLRTVGRQVDSHSFTP